MANGNGTNPAKDTQAIERLQAVAEAATAATSVDDFLARAEGALQLLETIGRELGSAGEADARDILAFAEGQRTELHVFVRKLLGRHRRRVGDLERILGRIEGPS
jgi:hypothetical protein